MSSWDQQRAAREAKQEREYQLEDELRLLNAQPKENPSKAFDPTDERWFTRSGRAAHYSARGYPIDPLPRLVAFAEPRQLHGVGLPELFGTFETVRTFSDEEAQGALWNL